MLELALQRIEGVEAYGFGIVPAARGERHIFRLGDLGGGQRWHGAGVSLVRVVLTEWAALRIIRRAAKFQALRVASHIGYRNHAAGAQLPLDLDVPLLRPRIGPIWGVAIAAEGGTPGRWRYDHRVAAHEARKLRRGVTAIRAARSQAVADRRHAGCRRG